MPKKIKLSLEVGQSYLVLDEESWEYLHYTISSVANQWGPNTKEHTVWMEWLASLESQYLENRIQENYEDEGWI